MERFDALVIGAGFSGLPAQPEIEAYLNSVADRLDLRRDVRLATAVVAPTVLMHPSCNYNGGNVRGKKRTYMGYTGGIPEYRRRCDEIAAGGYTGFKLA